MKNLFIASICIASLLCSCTKAPSPIQVFDCDQLAKALVDKDIETLQEILDPELELLVNMDLDNDACPHDVKLTDFETLLNNSCSNLVTTVLCCNCIQTLPAISEMLIHVDSSGVEVDRILDLTQQQNGNEFLSLVGVH